VVAKGIARLRAGWKTKAVVRYAIAARSRLGDRASGEPGAGGLIGVAGCTRLHKERASKPRGGHSSALAGRNFGGPASLTRSMGRMAGASGREVAERQVRQHRCRILLGVVGFACAVLVMLAPLSTNALGMSWAPGVEATPPANAGSDPLLSLGPVSCASAGNCSAVGGYRDGSGNGQGLLLSEAVGTWTAGVEAKLPANAGSNPSVVLSSLSCASPGDCTAVGRYSDTSGHAQGLLLTKTGGTWAQGVQAVLPAGAGSDPNVNVGSVSCASAGNCSAVGAYADSSGNGQGLLLNETADTWATGIKAPLPADAKPGYAPIVSAVSCASAGNCGAVGSYTDSSRDQQGLLIDETGGKWTRGEKATPPADAGSNPSAYFGSVSCASAGNCSAVGAYADNSGHPRGLLSREIGGSWAPAVAATLPGDSGYYAALGLSSVSCASAGNCSAVGSYGYFGVFVKPPGPGVLLSEAGGTWAPGIEVTEPASASANPSISEVSCASDGNCAAVGTYLAGSHDQEGLLLS
jgi:hypothetical protein